MSLSYAGVMAAVSARRVLGTVLVSVLPLHVGRGHHARRSAAQGVTVVTLPLRLPEGGAVLPAAAADS